MSTETYARILWVVLDGFGHEHARRLLSNPGRFPALERIARDGHLGACRPPEPVCQTPPALLALFTGSAPAENGVWGYKVPDRDGQLERSISGFAVERKAGTAIWEDLEASGRTFSIMNVGFRRDRVWSDPFPHLAFAYDGYRSLRAPSHFSIPAGSSRITFEGIDIGVMRRSGRVELRRGSRLLARLETGGAAKVPLTRGTRVFAHLLAADELTLYPESPALVRLGPAAPSSAGRPPDAEGYRDMSAFRRARSLNDHAHAGERVTVESELLPSRAAMRQKADLMRWAVKTVPANLTICYVPLMDEFNHTWFHLCESQPFNLRAEQLFGECGGMIDAFLAELMALADHETLLVVSSDHGALPFRRLLHLNEAFADAGLVRRTGSGYDYVRSTAWYHPSDCGQVVVNEREARRRGMAVPALRAAALAALGRANDAHGARIAAVEPGPSDPFLLYLYPEADTYFTGDPPRSGKPALNPRRSGGHHLSPLTPSPWIDAMIGLWSPRPGARAADGAPARSTEVKGFLLRRMSR
ncbi:MAG: alkaline phosphatase family protein [Spirochaetes bacterium]|nr:alkaline phosphatase family protein [Spirochaetota bacterium]